MPKILKTCISFLLVVIFTGPASSQSSPVPAVSDEQASPEQQRARWLLESLFEEANSCDDQVFRIRLQADISDLLWAYNENRARLQFQKILQAINEMNQDDGAAKSVEFDIREQLLGELTALLKGRDPEWAKELENGSGTLIEESTIQIPPAKQIRQTPSSPKAIRRAFLSANSGSAISVTDRNISPAQRDGYYLRVFNQELGEGKYAEALQSADNIGLKTLRARLKTTARSQAAFSALSRDDFDCALKNIREIDDISQRAALYSRLIKRLWDKKDTSRVIETLSEAEQWISKTDDSPVRVRVLLTLVEAAASFDPQRGFELMQIAVSAINRAMDQGDFEIHTSIFERSFQPLARADFSRALQLARSIDNDEMSAQSEFAICRGLLRD